MGNSDEASVCILYTSWVLCFSVLINKGMSLKVLKIKYLQDCAWKIWINSCHLTPAIYQVLAAWQLSDWGSFIKLNCKYITEHRCFALSYAQMCPALCTFCHRCYSGLQEATQQVYEAAIMRDGFQQNNADRNCSFIPHLRSQRFWSWSQLSWGEDGATSRQRTSHTNACGNVWAQYQSALMCVPLHCRGKQSSCRETRQIQGEHASSTRAAWAPNQCLSLRTINLTQ